MRYYIADCHFFHAGLNEHMDGRGFSSVEAMNNYMISQWNSRVRRNDEVIILGDFSIGKPEETLRIVQQLKGQLYLVLGNHDKWAKKSGVDLSRFKWVKDYAQVNDNGRKVICCHYPIACYNGQFRRSKKGNAMTYMLHGHIHNTEDVVGLEQYKAFVRSYPRRLTGSEEAAPAPINIINCFCMFSDYIPLTLDEWIALEENRQQEEPAEEVSGLQSRDKEE